MLHAVSINKEHIIGLDTNSINLSIPLTDIYSLESSVPEYKLHCKPIIKRQQDLTRIVTIDSANNRHNNAISAPIDTVEVAAAPHIRKEETLIKTAENGTSFMKDLRGLLWLVLAIVGVTFLGDLYGREFDSVSYIPL